MKYANTVSVKRLIALQVTELLIRDWSR